MTPQHVMSCIISEIIQRESWPGDTLAIVIPISGSSLPPQSIYNILRIYIYIFLVDTLKYGRYIKTDKQEPNMVHWYTRHSRKGNRDIKEWIPSDNCIHLPVFCQQVAGRHLCLSYCVFKSWLLTHSKAINIQSSISIRALHLHYTVTLRLQNGGWKYLLMIRRYMEDNTVMWYSPSHYYPLKNGTLFI